jgi:hypothetical protein
MRLAVSSTAPLFPLDEAEKYLRGIFSGLERSDSTLEWPDRDGRSQLRVDRVDVNTRDGLVVKEVVRLNHWSPALEPLTSTFGGQINRWATLSGITSGVDARPAGLTCQAGIFAPDRAAAEHVYAPLLCTEATIIGWHAALLARGHFHVDPNDSPLQRTSDTTPYGESDFQTCLQCAQRMGLFANADEHSLTAEVPWDPGALSHSFKALESAAGNDLSETDLARLGGRTSLLWLTTEQPHAMYGNGVLSRLELPLPVDGSSAEALVAELNQWELSTVDLPPLFGAWCLGPRAPTFVSFVPNAMCVPGLLVNLLCWNRVRAARVREWIGNPSLAKN